MAITVVDSPENEQTQARWFLDTLVLERRCAPEMDTVTLETTLPVGSAPPLRADVRFKPQPRCLKARWVPDPTGRQSLICVWVPQTRVEASTPRPLISRQGSIA